MCSPDAELPSPDLVELAARVEVSGRCGFAVDGWRQRALNPRLAAEALTERLYARVYCRPTGEGPPADGDVDPGFLDRLSVANRGRATWEPGWRRRPDRDEPGRLAVSRYGLMLWADPASCRPDPRGGDLVCLRVPAERRRLLPGFYAFLGDAPWDDPTSPTSRFTWHLQASGAERFVELVSTRFNAEAIPFRAKVLGAAGAFARADAGLLELPRPVVERAWALLEDAHRHLRPWLREAVPLFTSRLAHGLAVADGSPDGASFGQARCRLAAEALLGGVQGRAPVPGERLQALARAFRAAGLDPARPHLASTRAEAYPGFSPGGRPARRHPSSAPGWLEAADRIGRTLVGSAVRQGGQCAWLGPRPASPTGTTLAPVGPDLHTGTAGIALFLGELQARTVDPGVRAVAREAIEHACRGADGAAPVLGFHAGLAGTAFAAARLAVLLEDEGLARRARTLLTRLARLSPGEAPWDVVSGLAGGLLALLAWPAEVLPREQPGLVARWAEALAERLPGTEGGPWGLAHGRAGPGLCLLEAGCRLGDRGLREAGAQALDRCQPGAEGPGSPSWCQGVPGLALARRRARALLDEAGGEEPEEDLAHCQRWLLAREASVDPTLCHGLGGPTEVLLAALASEEHQRGGELGQCLARVWRPVVARHGLAADWPGGVASRAPHPSLMLGAAGVGWTLLRLDDPVRTPSILLPLLGLPGGRPANPTQRSGPCS